MTIAYLGSVSLQIEREVTRQRFVEKLRKQLERVAREVVARCIEGSLGDALTRRSTCLILTVRQSAAIPFPPRTPSASHPDRR